MAAEQVQQHKQAGAAALAAKDFERAAKEYTAAIELAPEDPEVYKLYSNRSAVHATAQNYAAALQDAEDTVRIKPDWPKGYSRKGAALSFLGRHEDAAEAYGKGLELDPGNAQLKAALEQEQELLKPAVGGAGPGLGSLFDGAGMNILKTHPKTMGFFLQDPSFETILQMVLSNPQSMGNMLQDQRIMTCLTVLLEQKTGMKMQAEPQMPGGMSEELNEATAGAASGANGSDPMDVSSPPPPPAKDPETELSNDVKKALAEKELGNAAYKGRRFEEALTHYSAAKALDPTNMVFCNNIAAVYFEQGKLDECITECEQAVEIGRENRAPYNLIAKALARIANVHKKRGNYKDALKFYHKSISEHRDDAVVKKSKEIEKLLKEEEKKAYINPELAEEAKARGTELFKKGDFPGATKEYSEAIKRNPSDAKLFSNRAACYTKLLEFPMALSDCEKCIALDPAFVKGYLRKAQALLGLKDSAKALQAYQKALEIDPACQEAIEGRRNCMSNEDPEQVRKRAMMDPEVQQILKDPAMQSIMEQMQTDPAALREHLKNPDIAAKITKLHQSGLIAFR